LNLVAISIDAIADAALVALQSDARAAELRCDACDEVIEGEPAGHGLYLWTRGGEIRLEEPPLCGNCATAIGVTALQSWSVEEEEG
jgi:hypothetical protein